MRILLVFFMSPLFLTFLYDIVFYIPSLYLINYPYINDYYIYYFSIQIALYFILSLYFIKFMRFKYDNMSIEKHKGMPLICYIFLLLTCVILILFLLFSVFQNFDITNLFSQNGYFYAKSKIGTAWVYFVYQFILVLMIFDFYKSKYNRNKLLIIIFTIALLAMTGGRTTVISLFLLLLFIFSIVNVTIIKKRYIVILISIFSIIFFSNIILRGGEDNTLDNYFESNAVVLDFNNTYLINDTLKYIDNHDDYHFVSLIDFAYFFVPRALDPDKPISTAETRLLYSDMLSDGRSTNITFGLYGNLLINLGYLGIIIAPIFTFFMNYIYIKLCNRLPLHKSRDFILLYFFITYLIVLRGGIINSRVFASLLIVMVVIAFYTVISKLKIR